MDAGGGTGAGVLDDHAVRIQHIFGRTLEIPGRITGARCTGTRRILCIADLWHNNYVWRNVFVGASAIA